MKHSAIRAITAMVIGTLLFHSYTTKAGYRIPATQKASITKYIHEDYPIQLTNPEKKLRKTFSQFGYNLYEFPVPIFPITKFIKPDKFGMQSYGLPNRRMEKNGSLYTFRGGFIDFSHMRAAIDWTVYLSLMLVSDKDNIELPQEAGKLTLQVKNINGLSDVDITNMAQKIAFERLIWHEVASWHYHAPYHFISEQTSTFTPEDNYSNFLGTEIGKRVALRIIRNHENLSYSQIATEEIQKMITELEPVNSKRASKRAYDIVDVNKQHRLPAEAQNHDVWYDSKIVFHDQRYIFKRNLGIGPEIKPWLVPEPEKLGYKGTPKPMVFEVPYVASTGKSYYDYYVFTITPDSNMFYSYKKHKALHPPFQTFTTNNFAGIVDHIRKQMEVVLLPGFDKRNGEDPTIYYTDVKKVFLK
jgi:hypothetical protein